ncbi:transposase [Alloprevotella tannerae]|uniref:integrase core domain-containing protein n=1 Tax=Alloprevotella tannerae TaxID=76122 RepID=UPI0028EB77DF|nr:transposase [Alloprevotella tannerae]
MFLAIGSTYSFVVVDNNNDNLTWSFAHNALAERMNNTLKNGWLFSTEDKSLQQVRRLTKKAIDLYNTFRPHQSLQMRTPMEEVGRLTA